MHHVESQPRSPSKKSAKKKVKTDDRHPDSRIPLAAENDKAEDEDRPSSPSEGPSEIDLNILSKALQVARDSVYAADCCLALLSSDRLTKQVYVVSTPVEVNQAR